jgi:hypothetical protein
MDRSLSYRIRLWYRLACRYVHHLRRMCICFLTIAMVIGRIIEAVAEFYANWIA